MKQRLFLAVALVVGLVLGVALSNWRVFPTDDMIARASCASCHDVHAAIEWEDAPFQSQALEEVADALIATVLGKPTLLLPRASRGQWVIGVVEITLQS